MGVAVGVRVAMIGSGDDEEWSGWRHDQSEVSRSNERTSGSPIAAVGNENVTGLSSGREEEVATSASAW